MDDRVRDHLLGEVARARGAASGAEVTHAGLGGDAEAQAAGRVDALCAVGMLDRVDAPAWVAALATGAPGPGEVVEQPGRTASDDEPAAVARYLRGLVAGGALEPRFGDALDALQRAGLLDPEQRERLVEPAPVGVDPPADADVDGGPRFRGTRLRRVVRAPAQRRRGTRLTNVLLFDDGVVVQWQFVRRAPGDHGAPAPLADEVEPGARPQPPQWVGLTDDAGTSYEAEGGGAHGAGRPYADRVTRGSVRYVPAVPPQATRLLFSSADVAFEVALS
ncbi:MAG: hypothetical protein QOJ35_3964 [Solirubrobacteraceae bacterium]|jgi:hypothetical protein|nr:hypothetical protein [Solirubrobacteraceae bacterium]